MAFPGPYAEIIVNEAGEPIGWDNHYYDEPPYCDACGVHHVGTCLDDWDDEEPQEEGGEDRYLDQIYEDKIIGDA